MNFINNSHSFPNALFYTRTNQYETFRKTIATTHTILPEVIFKITPSGMVLQHYDADGNCIIKLDLCKFEDHYASRTFYIGVNLDELYTEMRFVNGNYMVLYIREPEPGEHVQEMRAYVYEDDEEFNEIPIPLIHRTVDDIEINSAETPTRIAYMPNTRLQRTIRTIAANSKKYAILKGKLCYIECEDRKLIFGACRDDYRVGTRTVIPASAKKQGMKWALMDLATEPNNFRNYYYIRYLEKFCKNQLDSQVLIMMRGNSVLTLKYIIGDLGYLYFILAPVPPIQQLMPSPSLTKEDLVKMREEFQLIQQQASQPSTSVKRKRMKLKSTTTKKLRKIQEEDEPEEPEELIIDEAEEADGEAEENEENEWSE